MLQKLCGASVLRTTDEKVIIKDQSQAMTYSIDKKTIANDLGIISKSDETKLNLEDVNFIAKHVSLIFQILYI